MSPSEPLLDHLTNDRGGAFVLIDDGERVAEMTYVGAGERRVIADHTWVSDKGRGRGWGDTMFRALIAWAEETETTIVPLCPFVKSRFEKHPELAHLRA